MTLPIETLRPALLASWPHQQCIVIKAPPGAGKSTQLPLWLLDLCGQGEQILLVQPRRLAAKALAQRLAHILGCPLGDTVGYQLSLDSQYSAQTRLLVITEGVLLNKLQHDPGLTQVSVVLLDEFHERHWQTDLCLALLEQLLQLRTDLHLLLLSATLDAEPIAAALSGLALCCEGRSHPVQTRYIDEPLERWPQLIDQALTQGRRGILVFLPGLAAIERLQRACQPLLDAWPALQLFCLHGSFDAQRQQQVLMPLPATEQRLILSTNVAETSLTLDGIDLVIDSGLERQPKMDHKTGIHPLIEQRITLASAEQRRGRAGRQGPGFCLRMWPESELLPSQQRPEILRTDLGPLCLQLAAMREPLEQLFWLDPPNSHAAAQAQQQLQFLAALDDQGQITATGQAMQNLGTQPRLAALLVQASHGEAQEAASLAAWLHHYGQLPEQPPATATNPEFKRLLARFCKALGVRPHFKWPQQPGDLLARAFPERLWLADQDKPKLASGRALSNPGQAKGWQLAIEASNQGQSVRQWRSLPVSLEAVEGLSHCWWQRKDIHWQQDQPKAKRVSGFLQLQLHEQACAITLSDWLAALCQRIKQQGLAWLPWSDAGQSFLDRWQLLADLEPELCSPEALCQQVEQWLPAWCPKVIPLAKLPWLAALKMALGADAERIERHLPKSFVLPMGLSLAIEYEQGLAKAQVKLQACFGLSALPLIAQGRIPMRLELLAPGGQVLAMTSDLAHFWQHQYPEVRKQMRGRYNKHPWPEDPMAAKATLQTNRQLRK